MTRPANITDNVKRVLDHLGLAGTIVLTRDAEDRVYGWPLDDSLLRHAVMHDWRRDIPKASNHFHGSPIGFRERGVRPSLNAVMQIPPDGNWPWVYFWELDLDEFSDIRHAYEVTRNAVTGKKTNQQRIAELLDRRFNNG